MNENRYWIEVADQVQQYPPPPDWKLANLPGFDVLLDARNMARKITKTGQKITRIFDAYSGRHTHAPYFIHDCPSCVWILSWNGSEAPKQGLYRGRKKVDVYVCPNEPTVIVRDGDEGWEYGSGMSFHWKNLCDELLRYHDRDIDGVNGTLSLAKAVVRQGRKRNRKFMSDFRRRSKAEIDGIFREEFGHLTTPDDGIPF